MISGGFTQNLFLLEVASNSLVHKFSSQSDEILILAAIYLNLVSRY